MSSPAISYKDRYNYKDYLSWNEGERWELIDGIAYNMSPGPSTLHQRISRDLSRTIGNYLEGNTCELFSAPFDVILAEANQTAEESSTVVQPDIAIFCNPKKIKAQGAHGAPDWVIEILSPGTANKDQYEKLLLYQTHGVREYWIVDPEEEIVKIHRLDKELKRYTLPQTHDRSDAVSSSVLPELTISLEEVFRAAE
ncbi:MAG TPA: Uma2 family endonuclease [Cytophagales bacterium]|nr:Uma2 family endonuclease [Cytophagales bacterium]HAP61679.1 Uma2 family endonuclease [Cytophagales bacterium]